MSAGRFPLPFLLAVVGLGLWFLLAGAEAVLGVDVGGIGFLFLLLGAGAALQGVRQLPPGDAELAVSPAEWRAWIATLFSAVAVAYFVAKAHVFQVPVLADSPAARQVGTHLVLLLVAWKILLGTVGARWLDRVQEDERDREIERLGARWWRGAMTAQVVGLALLLGFSPLHRLQWATFPMVANMLVLALMVGALFEYAATAVHHWRDRRACG